ncbi:hypothetical protein BHE97_11875 [Aeromicrobium sp. PE09-221]|uniref:hypothetical protein n=1 Tax=Aeromicrobium sp. PE09-221 TaxID=1898043 RepID=UPI000B3E4C99|nr:hypothetical protein [Aeromicrobium sp. PE09-221]OUZ09051.1 hypothetical protein BHE97_11875 [Aeromicrobium sp. PE09-221]
MTVRRIVPDVPASVEFYSGLLGMEPVMDHGWIVTLADPGDPARRLSVASRDAWRAGLWPSDH